MNIKDYAKDVNLSVAEVLRKCSELGIKADANGFLSDDDIIMLDNTINLISTNKETTYEEEDQIDEGNTFYGKVEFNSSNGTGVTSTF